jgi:cell division control protein 12
LPKIKCTEVEEKGFKTKLTLIDTPGFGDRVNNSACWEAIVKLIDQQHATYLENELKTQRQIIDLDDVRIHACLYFIAPTGHTLSALDVQAMKELGSRVNLIPVIAKADTLMPTELQEFKQRVCIILRAERVYCIQRVMRYS